MVVPPPFYGHPFYDLCDESDLFPSHGRRRAFIGADPAGGGSATVRLDPRQVLHAVITVDGKTYEGSIDLAPAIAAVMAKIAQFHSDLHAAMPASGTTISGDFVIGAVDRAVDAAAAELVGALFHRHYRVAGWWDSLTHGLKAVVDKAGDTIKALKGPISMAAAAGATAIVGPEAAPLASQITGALADAAGGDYKGAGQAALNVAQQAASQNPQVAQVLDTAKSAFAKPTAAHHVALTAHQASAGDPKAAQQVAQLANAAQQGDSAAQHLIASARNVAGGQFDLSSLDHHHHRVEPIASHRGPHAHRAGAVRAVEQVIQRYRQTGGPAPAAIAYVRLGHHQSQTHPFRSPAEAAHWVASLAPGAFSYAAAFNAHRLAVPIAERLGTAA